MPHEILKTTYQLTHKKMKDVSIEVDIDFENELTIRTADDHDAFKFKDSDPSLVRQIGELLIEAADLAEEKSNE